MSKVQILGRTVVTLKLELTDAGILPLHLVLSLLENICQVASM